MSVRVVARIRPLLKAEAEKDQILSIHEGSNGKAQIVKIPNPKIQSEEYSFNFAAAYTASCNQQELFDAEGKQQDMAVNKDADALYQSRPQSSTSSKASTLPCSPTESQAVARHTRCGEANRWLIAA